MLSNRAKTESARNPSHPTYWVSARFGSPPPQIIPNVQWNQPASRCRPLQSRNTRRTIRNGAALRPFEIISMLGQTKGPVTRIRTIGQRAQSIIRKRAAPTSIFLVWPDPKEIRRTAWWTKLLFEERHKRFKLELDQQNQRHNTREEQSLQPLRIGQLCKQASQLETMRFHQMQTHY